MIDLEERVAERKSAYASLLASHDEGQSHVVALTAELSELRERISEGEKSREKQLGAMKVLQDRLDQEERDKLYMQRRLTEAQSLSVNADNRRRELEESTRTSLAARDDMAAERDAALGAQEEAVAALAQSQAREGELSSALREARRTISSLEERLAAVEETFRSTQDALLKTAAARDELSASTDALSVAKAELSVGSMFESHLTSQRKVESLTSERRDLVGARTIAQSEAQRLTSLKDDLAERLRDATVAMSRLEREKESAAMAYASTVFCLPPPHSPCRWSAAAASAQTSRTSRRCCPN